MSVKKPKSKALYSVTKVLHSLIETDQKQLYFSKKEFGGI